LLEHFRDPENIKNATVEELNQVPGISRSMAEVIQKYFN